MFQGFTPESCILRRAPTTPTSRCEFKLQNIHVKNKMVIQNKSSVPESSDDIYLFRRLWKQDSVVADDSDRITKYSGKSWGVSKNDRTHENENSVVLQKLKGVVLPTCDKCVSIKSLEFIKFTAVYNSGNDLKVKDRKMSLKSRKMCADSFQNVF